MGTKTLKCKECGKSYTKWNGWMIKHIEKTSHRKFERINVDYSNIMKDKDNEMS